MRVFLAGASGVIGRPVTMRLLAGEHQVFAMTRSPQRAADLQRIGATAVVCDVFDRERLQRVVEQARPDAVVHQLTALPKRIDPRKIKTQLAATNRLRTEGTRILLEAAVASGAARFLAQSISFAYGPEGAGPKTEDSELYDRPPASFAGVVRAVQDLEAATLGSSPLAGVVLRYGFFYGPGTAYAPDGSFAAEVRARRVPIVGRGGGVWSFIHVDDAARATVAALESGAPGVYNIVDDEPAPVAEWLPAYAAALGALPPRRAPRWLVRPLLGRYAVHMMCDLRGASNAKAKRLLGWSPRYATWRTGFRQQSETPQNRETPATDLLVA